MIRNGPDGKKAFIRSPLGEASPVETYFPSMILNCFAIISMGKAHLILPLLEKFVFITVIRTPSSLLAEMTPESTEYDRIISCRRWKL